jgi:hypothetical protein
MLLQLCVCVGSDTVMAMVMPDAAVHIGSVAKLQPAVGELVGSVCDW